MLQSVKSSTWKVVAASTVAGQVVSTVLMGAHGKTGLVFPAGDAERLAHHLIQLHSDPGLAATLGRNAKEAASLRFDTDTVARAHAAVYRELSTMHR